MREPANVRSTESTLNSALIITPIKPVRHRCLTEFIGNSSEVEVWLAYICGAKLSETIELQVRCKSDVYKNSTSLFTNVCENRDMLMKNTDMVMKNRDVLIKKRDMLMKNRDMLMKNRDMLIKNRDMLIKNGDMLMKNRDMLMKNRDMLMKNRAMLIKKMGIC